MAIRKVGLSLIDEEPLEVLHLALMDLEVRASSSSKDSSLELLCHHLQVDACVPTTRFEVLLTPVPMPLAPNPDGSLPIYPTVHVSLSHDPRWAPVVYLRQVEAAIQPLQRDHIAKLEAVTAAQEVEKSALEEQKAELLSHMQRYPEHYADLRA